MVDVESLREADIHFSLHRAFSNVIDEAKLEGKKFDHIEFDKTKPEYAIPDVGRADLVLFDKNNKSWLVIEVKSTKQTNDPYSPKVIVQALKYASYLGSYYIATCDGRYFVLFDNKELGVPFWQRKRLPPYDLSKFKTLDDFAFKVLSDIAKLEEGVEKWQGIDEAFISRLKTLHELFTPYIFKSIKSVLARDPKFKEKYEEWLDEQGLKINEETHKKIAIETAYILINKILFYKVLETKYPSLPKLKKINLITERDFLDKLNESFRNALKIDYKAVFQHGIYDEIPLSQDLIIRLNEFLDEASDYDLSKVESDVIGKIYEGLIPKDERHKLGQYYTPPAICELIVKFCINNPHSYVLDPGCGTGGFLIKSYYHLLELMGKEYTDEEAHKKILNQLWGIDISQFPASLSVINLALRNIKAKNDKINIIPSDFFEVFHEQKRLKPTTKLTLEDIVETHELPPQFDAIVCNPPYTRQEEIGNKKYKDEIRKIALSFNGKQIEMSARAGIYAYFFTHSAHFLKEEGTMGYIVSNSWLDVDFGKYLQKFFLDNFKINAIIEFDRRAFTEASINTVIIILQKLTGIKNKEKRDNNIVKFVRIKKMLNSDRIVKLIETTNKDSDNDELRIIVKRQEELYDDNKWTKYLRASPVYFKIINNEKIVKLKDIAKVNRAVTTGANEFFVVDEDIIKQWNIEKEFIKPCIKSPQDLHFIKVESKDTTKSILLINKNENQLKGTKVIDYIKYGETKGYNKRPTCASRDLWYSLGDLKPSRLIFPYIIWERAFTFWNDANAIPIDVFHEIHIKDEFTKSLLSIMNSYIFHLFLELGGRTPFGEGALKIQAYELEEIPIIDPNKLSKVEKTRLENFITKIIECQRSNNLEKEKEIRKEMDNAIFKILDLTNEEIKQVLIGLKELRDMRKKRKEVEVLIK